MAPRARPRELCPWCGQPLRPIVAHGEVRCASCHMPVVICCEGAPLREHEVPACPIPETAKDAQAESTPAGGDRCTEQTRGSEPPAEDGT